jgi:hypothetical protein
MTTKEQQREASRRYRARHPEDCRAAEQLSRNKRRDYWLAYWREKSKAWREKNRKQEVA